MHNISYHIIIPILLTSSLIFSQNSELDARNGFKTMKFGTHMSAFTGLKELPSPDKSDVINALWKTSDEDLGYLFDDKIDYFQLSFEKESKKLVFIRVIVLKSEPFTEPRIIKEFDSRVQKFISILGKPNDVLKDEILGLAWYGEKIAMTYVLEAEDITLDDNYSPKGITSFNLSFYTKDYDTKKANSKGF